MAQLRLHHININHEHQWRQTMQLHHISKMFQHFKLYSTHERKSWTLALNGIEGDGRFIGVKNKERLASTRRIDG
jgi:hypothetical protein